MRGVKLNGRRKKLCRQQSKPWDWLFYERFFFSPIFYGPENQIKVVTHFNSWFAVWQGLKFHIYVCWQTQLSNFDQIFVDLKIQNQIKWLQQWDLKNYTRPRYSPVVFFYYYITKSFQTWGKKAWRKPHHRNLPKIL